MKLLVIGFAQHGKDTVAHRIAQRLNLACASSSEVAGRVCVYPALQPKYGYKTFQECFEDRVNHRPEWFSLIAAYNAQNPARLVWEILSRYDIYIGLRSRREFKAARSLFDHVLWVDASQRKPKEPSTSCELGPQDADIIIDNNKSLLETFQALDKLVCTFQ